MIRSGYSTVVVGAGSAGAVLAYRLAECGEDVLLLDAGPDYAGDEVPFEFRSPNPSRALVHPWADQLVWRNLVARRTSCQEPMPFLRGRGFGGSSVVNGQIAIRPPMEDFDRWADAGCTGWAAADVLGSFCRLEADEQFGDLDYHGSAGPTPVHRERPDTWGSVDNALRLAALDAGFAWCEDVNAPGASGVSPYPINSRDGRRVTTKDSYIEPGRALRTLTIAGDTLVDRVEFAGSRAVGVRVVRPEGVSTIAAGRVVLAAGAVHSPAILQRSGIGPSSSLDQAGVEVRVQLPVGLGLQDHPLAPIPLALNAASRSRTVDARHTNCCIRYASSAPDAVNDMMIVSSNHLVSDPAGLTAPTQYGFVGVWVNQVHSRGELMITSADPTVQPRIDERMLSDPRDLDRLREGIRALAALCRHGSFAAITDGATVEEGPDRTLGVPGPGAAELSDDRLLDQYLLRTTGDAAHISSTCRMGPPDADHTVVDPSCRVLGVEGLLVCDASVFPDCPRANTHLACVMAGEHLANLLSS